MHRVYIWYRVYVGWLCCGTVSRWPDVWLPLALVDDTLCPGPLSPEASLQGVKACLGWDRQPSGGVHSCTVVVDTWLKLFQRSLHAVRALRLTLPPLPELPDGRCVRDIAGF